MNRFGQHLPILAVPLLLGIALPTASAVGPARILKEQVIGRK